jgi:hypothetical protein
MLRINCSFTSEQECYSHAKFFPKRNDSHRCFTTFTYNNAEMRHNYAGLVTQFGVILCDACMFVTGLLVAIHENLGDLEGRHALGS